MGVRARLGIGLVVLGVLLAAAPASGSVKLANHCVLLKAKGTSARVYLKPTGLRTYLLYDARTPAGLAPEWALRRRGHARWTIRSTADGRYLRGRRAFRIRRARGCTPYPEAGLGAKGQPVRGKRRDGSLIGFADSHLHITANLRAGGQVISGEPFNRFGITEALGRDADVHGADGGGDITGNLLRTGNATGTHDTHGWPTFSGWPTRDTYTHQQVYYRWLQRAWMGGLRLVVAQAVEDEPLCNIEPKKSHSCDEMATIELEVQQLRKLQDYVDAQSGGRGRGWFRLVYTPAQARKAIARGKLAVIIGVESSNPFGCSESMGQPRCDRAAIDRGIARMKQIGVRSMFVAHWVDNALAGAALEGGDKGTFIAAMQVSQTGGPFVAGPCPHPGQGEEVAGLPGRQCNQRRLTDLGAYAVGKLMDNRMLIEMDHMSEFAREDVLAIAEQRRYPLVSSHTGTGGAWDASELRRLYALGGFAAATVDEAAALPAKVLAFRSYSATAAPALATDTGGFAALPGPAKLAYPFRAYAGKVRFGRERTGTRTFDLNKDGVAHYGLIPDLLAATAQQPQGRQALDVLFRSADGYVRTWQLATTR